MDAKKLAGVDKKAMFCAAAIDREVFSHIGLYMETCNDFRNFILEIIRITSST